MIYLYLNTFSDKYVSLHELVPIVYIIKNTVTVLPSNIIYVLRSVYSIVF